MYKEKLNLPIRVGKVEDPETYYKALAGSQLVIRIADQGNNMIARGMGVSWNENYQMHNVMEIGQRHCIEIVKGAMTPGQLNIQAMYFMQLNDTMPTFKNLVSNRELTAIIQIAEHEDERLKGLVIDVFEGVTVQGQQGNFNAQGLYMRNASMIYRKRFTGLEWKQSNAGVNYPATVGDEVIFDGNSGTEISGFDQN